MQSGCDVCTARHFRHVGIEIHRNILTQLHMTACIALHRYRREHAKRIPRRSRQLAPDISFYLSNLARRYQRFRLIRRLHCRWKHNYSEDGGSKLFKKIAAYLTLHMVPLASLDTAIAGPIYEMQGVLVQTFCLFRIF